MKLEMRFTKKNVLIIVGTIVVLFMATVVFQFMGDDDKASGETQEQVIVQTESEDSLSSEASESEEGETEKTKDTFLSMIETGLMYSSIVIVLLIFGFLIYIFISVKDRKLAGRILLASSVLLIGLALFTTSMLIGHEDVTSNIMMHLFLSILYSLCVVAYFFIIQKSAIVEWMYCDGWRALIAHAFLLLSVIPLCMMLISLLWGFFVGALIVVIVCRKKLTGENKPWTTIKEGNGKFIVFGGEPIQMQWAFKGFVELAAAPGMDVDGTVDGTVLRKEELYISPACHSDEKLKNLSTGEMEKYGPDKKLLVWYKRPITIRTPRKLINISAVSSLYFDKAQAIELEAYEAQLRKTASDSSDEPKPDDETFSFPLQLERKDIFFTIAGMEMSVHQAVELVRRKQLKADIKEIEALELQEQLRKPPRTLARADQERLRDQRLALDKLENGDTYKSIVEELNADVIDMIGVNYWSFITGFYMKHPSNPKKLIRLQSEAVMHKKVGNIGIPAYVRKENKGDGNLFGNYFYVGPKPLFSVYKYHFTWKSPDDQSRRDEENIDHIRFSDDVYEALLEGAEDKNQLRLDLKIWMKIRIVNPRLALFRIEKWFENVKTITLTHYRQMVGGAVFADIYREKDQYGVSWTEQLQATISDPKGEDLERRYGVRILTIEVIDVSPAGASKEEMAKAQAAKWLAERHAEATIATAKGEVERVDMVFDAIRKHGSDGMALRYFETLETAAKGEGTTILLGSLESTVKSVMSGGSNEKLAEILVGLGIGGEKANKLLDLLKPDEKESSKEVSSS